MLCPGELLTIFFRIQERIKITSAAYVDIFKKIFVSWFRKMSPTKMEQGCFHSRQCSFVCCKNFCKTVEVSRIQRLLKGVHRLWWRYQYPLASMSVCTPVAVKTNAGTTLSTTVRVYILLIRCCLWPRSSHMSSCTLFVPKSCSLSLKNNPPPGRRTLTKHPTLRPGSLESCGQ